MDQEGYAQTWQDTTLHLLYEQEVEIGNVIFLLYKIICVFICQEDFFNHLAPTAVGIVFHYQLEIDYRAGL